MNEQVSQPQTRVHYGPPPEAPGFIDQLVYKQACTIDRLVAIINEQQETINALKSPDVVAAGKTPTSDRATLELADQVTKWMDKEEAIWKECFERDNQIHKRVLDVERVTRAMMDAATQPGNGTSPRMPAQQIG